MSRSAIAVVWALMTVAVVGVRAAEHPDNGKLDAVLSSRAHARPPRIPHQTTLSRVIIRTVDGSPATSVIAAVGGKPGRFFSSLGGQLAIVPDTSLDWIAS